MELQFIFDQRVPRELTATIRRHLWSRGRMPDQLFWPDAIQGLRQNGVEYTYLDRGTTCPLSRSQLASSNGSSWQILLKNSPAPVDVQELSHERVFPRTEENISAEIEPFSGLFQASGVFQQNRRRT